MPLGSRRSPRRGKLSAAEKRPIREAVFRRDGGCLLAGYHGTGKCYGPLTAHHKRKASQGGSYSMENLIALCAHHNDELEADADLAAMAHGAGFVIRRGDPGWEQLGS